MVDVDDEVSDFTITLSVVPPVGEGKAKITNIVAPSQMASGQSFNTTVYVKNTGDTASDLYARIEDRDTGGVVGARKLMSAVGVGAIRNVSWTLTMPDKDWKLRVVAGHVK